MASLEDKILNGPRENYCSSDDESDEAGDEGPPAPGPTALPTLSSQGPPPPTNKWEGTSQNTGPKGVLRDWELFKAHEEHLRKVKEQELVEIVKANSLMCKTHAEDQADKETMQKLSQELEEVDIDDLLSDKILEKFVQQRMTLLAQGEEIYKPIFGPGLIEIPNGEDFLKVVDQTNPRIPVIMHIYNDIVECTRLNECLNALSSLYKNVQFCKIRANVAGVSGLFSTKGVPAMLVYKGGNLIGNFVQLKEEFGSEFFEGDVENFLIENGMLEDKSNIPTVLAKNLKKIVGK